MALSDTLSTEILIMIHNLWSLNYGLVHVKRILTIYQNKLLSKIQFFPDQLYIFKQIKTYLLENFTLFIFSLQTSKNDLK